MAKFKGTDGNDLHGLTAKRDVVRMLGGDDSVYFNATTFQTDDRLDGGSGLDYATLTNGGFYNFGHGRFSHFESLGFDGTGNAEVYIDDSVVARNRTMFVSAIGLEGGDSQTWQLFFDGAAERDGSLNIHGSSFNDALIGGGRDDRFSAGQGDDLLTGNEGSDTFEFLSDSQLQDTWGNDRITDFHPGEDHLALYTASATSFDELILRRTSDGLVVRTPGSDASILLYGLLPKDLHAEDVTIVPRQIEPLGHHALTIPHDGPLV